MADNRMYLKCNACNEILRIGRFNYMDGWHDMGPSLNMDEWFKDHKDCWFMLSQNQTCEHKHHLFSLEFEDSPNVIPICEAFPIRSWKEDV